MRVGHNCYGTTATDLTRCEKGEYSDGKGVRKEKENTKTSKKKEIAKPATK